MDHQSRRLNKEHMNMSNQFKLTKLGFMKSGAGAGLIAGFGLFSSFFGIDQWLDLPIGTFYKTIGLTMGLDQFAAIAAGFMAHMGTAALIGSMYVLASSKWRFFQLVTVPKAIMTGVLTAMIVFTFVFIPIHMFIMSPILEVQLVPTDYADYSLEEQNGLATILYNSKVITIALTLHIVFGAIMGLMSGIFLHDEYEKVPRKRGIF